MGTIMGVLTILLAVAGALLLSYAARQIHPAAVPLLWSAFFLGNVAAFLAGNSDGMMADLAVVMMAGIPGMVLLIISIRIFLRDRRRAVS